MTFGSGRNNQPDPLGKLDSRTLERLSALAAHLLAGRPLHPGGPLAGHYSTSGTDFVDHRAFCAGDDPGRIDWRASARRRQPVVRRYRDDHAGDWLIALDRSASMGAAGAWPLAVQLAAGASFLLAHHGHRVLLALFSDALDTAIGPARGRESLGPLHALLRTTSPVPPARDSARGLPGTPTSPVRNVERRLPAQCSRPETCLPLVQRRRVLLISDCLSPDGMSGALRTLAGAGSGLELLLVRAPLPELRASGRLQDAETGELRTIADTQAAVRSAQTASELMFAETRAECRRLGIPVTVVPLDQPWDQALLTHLLGHWRRHAGVPSDGSAPVARPTRVRR